MTDLTFLDRIHLLRNLDVTGQRLLEMANEYTSEGMEDEGFLSDGSFEGSRREIVTRAFGGLDGDSRLLLLQSWAAVAEAKTKHVPPARVCVTGMNPEGYDHPVMDTAQAFLDVISKATQRVVVMGYRLNDGNERLMDGLDSRMRKDGIEVCVVTDHLLARIGGHDQRRLVEWLGDGRINFRLWSFEPGNDWELMHVKCMFADKSIAYIGSANFSYGGSKRNLEIGLLVHDDSVLDALDSIYRHLVSGSHKDVVQITYHELRRALGK